MEIVAEIESYFGLFPLRLEENSDICYFQSSRF